MTSHKALFVIVCTLAISVKKTTENSKACLKMHLRFSQTQQKQVVLNLFSWRTPFTAHKCGPHRLVSGF